MLDIKNIPETYEVIKNEFIEDLDARAMLLKHKKTGARVAVLSNDDDNKVFNIAFRTPPADSTGVAHITEHSVLCGSRDFPLKDPFVELIKGSLNTFLNAMTYPDKTAYPVASCNEEDFKNLMHIYLDAVFYPNIYIHDEIFRQEGWHYEINDEGELFYNGVVYNEMKGAFSSPEEVLFRMISTSLFPDTIYAVESGGDPDVIPQLSYENFLDFHRRYYHPSNSYIYLYGDMDVKERLEFLDREYLSAFDAAPVDSKVSLQKPFTERVFVEDLYPADSEDAGSYMACNWALGENGDVREFLAYQILEYLLMEAPGAPLKQALQDKGYGEDIFGNFESSVRQPYLSIVIKNMKPEDKDDILALINHELKKLADGALKKRSLEGAINAMEFKNREADFGRWPKGLMYGLQMMDTWLYDDDNVFEYLRYQPAFDFFREKLQTDYFEELIRKSLLENPHSSVILLKPKMGLSAEREEKLKEKLREYKSGLSPEQVQKIKDDTAQLKAYQSEPSAPEDLEKIPLLSISDIKKEAEPLFNTEIEKDGIRILHHDIETKGIAYVNLLFDLHHIAPEDVCYLGMLAEILAELDTDKYNYQELTDEINLHTGGLRTNISVYGKDLSHDYVPVFSVGAKALSAKLPELFGILESLICGTDYSDTQRIKDILSQTKSRLEMSLQGSAHAACVARASSYFSEGAWFRELCEGIEFYKNISGMLRSYEDKKAEIAEKLRSTAQKVFCSDRLLVDWTGDRKVLDESFGLIKALSDRLWVSGATEDVDVGLCPNKCEAFTTPGSVQYNCVAADFTQLGYSYSGAMAVLKNILANEYLWNQVRVKGGAYGCMCGFTAIGDAYFTSYRDPKLSETFRVYSSVSDYLKDFELDDREMRKYIIGAFGSADSPMTASMKGARSLAAYLSGRDYEYMQEKRDEMRSVTKEKIREFAPMMDYVASSGNICVIGSESAIMKEKDMFLKIEALLEQ